MTNESGVGYFLSTQPNLESRGKWELSTEESPRSSWPAATWEISYYHERTGRSCPLRAWLSRQQSFQAARSWASSEGLLPASVSLRATLSSEVVSGQREGWNSFAPWIQNCASLSGAAVNRNGRGRYQDPDRTQGLWTGVKKLGSHLIHCVGAGSCFSTTTVQVHNPSTD